MRNDLTVGVRRIDPDIVVIAARCIGTLRSGEQRDINLLLPAPTFMGYAQTPGVLYHLGAYPGIRLGGSGLVQGEIYQIMPELERQLDELEEVWPQQTGEYTRQEVRVTLTETATVGASVESLTCLIYEVAAQRTAGIPVIASGDWVKRLS